MTIPTLEHHRKPFCGVFRGIGLVSLVVLLAGCSVYEATTDIFSDPLVLPCPDYRVVADAAKLVRFGDGPGRDLTDVNYESEIESIKLACTSDIDKKTRSGTMEVEITVVFLAQRGPANRDRKAPIEYFISVIDSTRKILYREAFQVIGGFPGNKTRLTFWGEPVTLEIPITPKRSSRAYRILTGFKLTREELQFNRTRLSNQAR